MDKFIIVTVLHGSQKGLERGSSESVSPPMHWLDWFLFSIVVYVVKLLLGFPLVNELLVSDFLKDHNVAILIQEVRVVLTFCLH